MSAKQAPHSDEVLFLGRRLPAITRRYVVTLSSHPEWLAGIALLAALLVLFIRLGSAGDAALGQWISSDTLYPVNLFIDIFRDHYSLSGWRFSIASCWFPDLAATGLFWALTQNAVLATLLAGFTQLIAIAAGFHLIARAIGRRTVFLQDTVLLAFGVAVTLMVAAQPGLNYPALYSFFLPQTHVGSMLLVLYGWGLALLIIRKRRAATPTPWWLIATYGALCFLAGMSNVLFFPHMLAPLTVALTAALFFELIGFRHCWQVVVVGWLTAVAGAGANHILFSAATVAQQASLGLDQALKAFDVFVRGSTGMIIGGDKLHIAALMWAAVCAGYIAWFLRRLVVKATQPLTESEFLAALFLTMCLLSSVLSVAAIVLGGSNGLVVFKNYVWTMHYLHQTFLLAPFGLLVIASWVADAVFDARKRFALAWAISIIGLAVVSVRLIGVPKAETPIYSYRPPIVRFVDSMASREGLHYGYAGYWQARLITLLSIMHVRAYAVDGTMNPLLWVNNSDWYHESVEDHSKPPPIDFVVLDDPRWKLTREAAVRAFGEPRSETQTQDTRVLILRRQN